MIGSSINLTTRLAKEADLPEILEIVNYGIRFEKAPYEHDVRILSTQLAWYQSKLKAQRPVIVAMVDRELWGFGTFDIFRPKIGYQHSMEHSVYVRHDKQCQGIGSALMRDLIQQARASGYHTLIAAVDDSNIGSVRFHKRHGFHEVGRFKEIGNKFNCWLNLIFMQLMLNE